MPWLNHKLVAQKTKELREAQKYGDVLRSEWPTYEEAFRHDPDGHVWEFDTLPDCISAHNSTHCENIAKAHGGSSPPYPWTRRGEFMIYHTYTLATTIRNPSNRRFLLQDSCAPDLCSSDAHMDGWGINDFTSPCKHKQMVCRTEAGPVDMRLRPTMSNHLLTCDKAPIRKSIHGTPYASLHREEDGTRMGFCWFDKSKNFSRRCHDFAPLSLFHSHVRCKWDEPRDPEDDWDTAKVHDRTELWQTTADWGTKISDDTDIWHTTNDGHTTEDWERPQDEDTAEDGDATEDGDTMEDDDTTEDGNTTEDGGTTEDGDEVEDWTIE